MTSSELIPLFRSAEQYLRMWDRVDASQVAAVPLDDQVPPVTTATVLPAAEPGDWRNRDVAIQLSAIDYGEPDKAPSGGAEILHGVVGTPVVVTASADAFRQLGQDGVYELQFSARDLRGNQEVTQSLQIKLDKTPPTIVSTGRTPANSEQWNNGPVTAQFACADALSQIASCTGDASVAAEGAGQSISGTAIDHAGNRADAVVSPVNIDLTPPLIVINARTPANVNGWNRTNVEVSAECSDALSGIWVCEGPKTLASEGASQTLALATRDRAGNESTATANEINIDKSAPLVRVTGVSSGQTYLRGAVPAGGCETADQPTLSGVAVPAVLAISGGTAQGVGSFIASCSGAEDRADNGAPPVSAAYSVHYPFAGFFAPIDNLPVVNVMNAGRAVPVKFKLGGNMGLTILGAGGPRSIPVSCDTGAAAAEVEEQTTDTNSGLSYDAGSDQYNYGWKTDKAYAGSCRRFELNLNDGSSHTFVVRFR